MSTDKRINLALAFINAYSNDEEKLKSELRGLIEYGMDLQRNIIETNDRMNIEEITTLDNLDLKTWDQFIPEVEKRYNETR